MNELTSACAEGAGLFDMFSETDIHDIQERE